MSTHITPPVYAKRMSVKADKVVGWINKGELRAVNVATKRGGRPRWRISEEAIADFEASRSVRPVVKQTRRRKNRQEVTEYF